jgi:hypothetical protein
VLSIVICPSQSKTTRQKILRPVQWPAPSQIPPVLCTFGKRGRWVVPHRPRGTGQDSTVQYSTQLPMLTAETTVSALHCECWAPLYAYTPSGRQHSDFSCKRPAAASIIYSMSEDNSEGSHRHGGTSRLGETGQVPQPVQALGLWDSQGGVRSTYRVQYVQSSVNVHPNSPCPHARDGRTQQGDRRTWQEMAGQRAGRTAPELRIVMTERRGMLCCTVNCEL